MPAENYRKVQAAYSFLKENIGNNIKLNEIAAVSGWKERSVSTYYNKKWKDLVLRRTDRGIYHVCMPVEMSLEDFGTLHSQVDEHLR